jgi:rRNA maturation endonuclease Nob1
VQSKITGKKTANVCIASFKTVLPKGSCARCGSQIVFSSVMFNAAN